MNISDNYNLFNIKDENNIIYKDRVIVVNSN